MKLRANALIGGVLVGWVGLMALVSILWTPYEPLKVNLRMRLKPPSPEFLLGTDEFGRDILSRIMAGAGTSLLVAALTVLVALALGIVIGLAAGYFRGLLDRVLMVANDAVLAFPGILLALGVMVVLGANKWGIILALGLAYAPTAVRVVRGTVLSLREKEYIEASQVIGNSPWRTVFVHILPNCVAPLVVLATSMFGWVVLAESALSFLGLGVPPPAPTWGNMLSSGRPYIESAAWLGIAPGVCIALTLLGINLLGDALRDWLDPRMAPPRSCLRPPPPRGGAASGPAKPVPRLPREQALLSVQGLSVEGAPGVRILDAVSFDIAPGQVVALVGESGSGKTMAGRAAMRLLPPQVRQTGGRIELDGRDIGALSSEQMRALRGSVVGMVFQEPMVSLNPAMTIEEQLLEGLLLHEKITPQAAREKAVAMLRRVQISDPEGCLKAHPHQFSGGMRQRIMLASVMLLKPRLLIADEPTTALDSLSQREVMEIMADLTRTEGTAVLLITHDLGLVARYAQSVVVLEKGKLVEAGPVREVLTKPREAYTRSLIDALPQRGTPRPGLDAQAPLIEARDVVVSFPGAGRGLFSRTPPKAAVQGVSLAIHPGEAVALVGGSGSGKTTLGRAMIGLLPLAGGEVRFKGMQPRLAGRAARIDFRLQNQLVFQDPYSSLDPRQKVWDIVAEPLRHGAALTKAETAAVVEEMLQEVGLKGFGERYPHALSGGQRQRVAIARALVRKPAFVVADEPVSALDMTIQKQVLQLFKRLQSERGFACLFISHNMAVVSEIADRIVVMNAGKIVEEGSVADIFDRPRDDYTRELLKAATTADLLAQLDEAAA